MFSLHPHVAASYIMNHTPIEVGYFCFSRFLLHNFIRHITLPVRYGTHICEAEGFRASKHADILDVQGLQGHMQHVSICTFGNEVDLMKTIFYDFLALLTLPTASVRCQYHPPINTPHIMYHPTNNCKYAFGSDLAKVHFDLVQHPVTRLNTDPAHSTPCPLCALSAYLH